MVDFDKDFLNANVALLILLLIPIGFYIRTLNKAVRVCSNQTPAISPRLLWLMLIPAFNVFWHFYSVLKMSKSLDYEISGRKIEMPAKPGLKLGLITCTLSSIWLLSLIGLMYSISVRETAGVFNNTVSPNLLAVWITTGNIVRLLGLVTGIAALVCWIGYWAFISRCSRKLHSASAHS